jgi:hypothetical protein
MGTLAIIAEQLENAVLAAQTRFETAKKGEPDAMIRLYVAADEEYDRLDKARKAMGALLEGVSRNFIPELMAERSIKTISLDDIKRRISVSTRISASIVPDQKAMAFNWLREHGAAELIQSTVNAGTLSSFAKERIEEGFDLPGDLFKMSSMQYTSVTKLK